MLYQSVRRARMESVTVCSRGVASECLRIVRRGKLRAQRVPFSAPSTNHGILSWIVELPPQALHVDVDHVRQRLVGIVPDVLGDVGAANDLAGASREIFEQRIFSRRERN